MILVNDNYGNGVTEVAIFSTPQEQAKSRDTPKYAKTFTQVLTDAYRKAAATSAKEAEQKR